MSKSMPISRARKRNSSIKIGSIRMEDIPDNFLVLIKLRRLLIQTKP